MHWFLDPIKHHYADFTGRTSRQAFWMFVLFYFLCNVAFTIIEEFGPLGQGLSLAFGVVLILPCLAITARRLHDIGKSGWWQLVGFIPILGWIVLIYWNVQPSEAGANAYGPNPHQSAPTRDVPPAPSQSDIPPQSA